MTLERLCLACAAVGLEFGGRAYLDAEPVRDRGHLKLLDRLRWRMPSRVSWAVEVPVPIRGDRRAIDAVSILGGARVGFEAELRLEDLQALQRRLALKKRDARLDILILVIADTRHNRHVLSNHREALRASFPLDTRAVLLALGSGRPPARDGLAVI